MSRSKSGLVDAGMQFRRYSKQCLRMYELLHNSTCNNHLVYYKLEQFINAEKKSLGTFGPVIFTSEQAT